MLYGRFVVIRFSTSFAILEIFEFLEFFWLTAGMQRGGLEKKGKREVDIRPLRRFPRWVVEVFLP